MKIKLLLCCNLLLTTTVFSAEHIAKKGDTLSEVASLYIPGKIYGSDGSLSQVLSLNPAIANPNFIYPGQVIIIGERSEASSEPVSAATTADLPYETTDAVAEVPQEAPTEAAPMEEGLIEEQPTTDASQELYQAGPQEVTESFSQEPPTDEAPQEVLEDPSVDSGKWFKSTYEIYGYLGSMDFEAKNKETGEEGSVPSESSYGIRLGWNQHWNEKFKSSLILDLNKVSFEKPNNAELEKGDPTLYKFGIGRQYQITSSISIYDHFFYGSEVYYFTEDNNTVWMDKGNAFSNRLGLMYENVNFEPFKLMTYGGLSSIFPSKGLDYDSESGQGYHAGLGVGRLLQGGKLVEGIVEYQHLNKDTTFIDQVEDTLKFSVGLKWNLE